MASRILGMGDVLSLIERAQAESTWTRPRPWRRRSQAAFDLEDFLDQMQQVKKMGPLQQILEMIPGIGRREGPERRQGGRGRAQADRGDHPLMTLDERRQPDIINGSRRRRIAKGSGTTVQRSISC